MKGICKISRLQCGIILRARPPVAGIHEYSLPLAIIDMGTASTVSVVDEKKHYVGGMIFPGMGVSLDALTARASQLSGISIEAPKRIIGKNTIECMKSGVIYRIIKRQPLHSFQLEFAHPVTGENMCMTAPVPEDFAG